MGRRVEFESSMNDERFESAALYMHKKQFERTHPKLRRTVLSAIFGPIRAGTMIDCQRRSQERYVRGGGTVHSFGECRTSTACGFPL